MSDIRVLTRAPSNIALIKYMGKDDPQFNLPANPSLSLTLQKLCTITEVRRLPSLGVAVKWVPECPAGVMAVEIPHLSSSAIDRVIRHADRVRSRLHEILEPFALVSIQNAELEIRTANFFPVGIGIASSASSFASITLAVAAVCSGNMDTFRKIFETELPLRRHLAALSREGSGSSCRSFEGPWVLWEREHASQIEMQMPEMTDFILIPDQQPKKVSSSLAHLRVHSSPLWNGRTQRVWDRLGKLRCALQAGNIRAAAPLVWTEMWEMHSLFHTCSEPFTYWEPGTLQVLKWLEPYVQSSEPPLVTMDAGASVHILVPTAKASEWKERLKSQFPQFAFLEDQQGLGVSFV